MKDSMMGSDFSHTRNQTIFINLKAKESLRRNMKENSKQTLPYKLFPNLHNSLYQEVQRLVTLLLSPTAQSY